MKTKASQPTLEPIYQARFLFKTNPDGCVLQVDLNLKYHFFICYVWKLILKKNFKPTFQINNFNVLNFLFILNTDNALGRLW